MSFLQLILCIFALLTDGVAVVIYKTMSTFNEMDPSDIDESQILLGLMSFFTIALGGLVIGIVMGVITSLITRTTTEVRGTVHARYSNGRLDIVTKGS